MRALTESYENAIAHPNAAARELEHEVSGLDPSLVAAELPGEIGAFTGPEHRFGVFDTGLLRRWAHWEVRFGIVTRPPHVDAMFSSDSSAAERSRRPSGRGRVTARGVS